MKSESLVDRTSFLTKNEASEFLGKIRNKRGLHEECVQEGCTFEEVIETHEWIRRLRYPRTVRLITL